MKILLLLLVVFLIQAVSAENGQTQTCDICKFVIQSAEKYVNESEADIQKALVHACSYLPQQFEQLCDVIVLQYGHQLIQLILKKETADVACKQLQLCPNTTESVLVRTEQVEAIKVTSDIVTAHEKIENDAKCSLCTLVVSSIENYVASNKTEQEMEKELEKLCSLMPQQYSVQCKATIDEYLPYIVYYVKEKFPADKVCSLIKLCAAIDVPVQVASSPQCSVCQYVIAKVEENLPQNATEQQVVELLNQVCQNVPIFKAQCIAFVQTYASQAVHLIMQKAPPQQVCQFLKVCDAALQVRVGSPLFCASCKKLVQFAENYITKSTTEQEIVAIVSKACNYFPKQYQAQCTAVVQLYGPAAISTLIAKYGEPQAVCSFMQACAK